MTEVRFAPAKFGEVRVERPRLAEVRLAPAKLVEVMVAEIRLAEERFWEEKSQPVRLLLERLRAVRSRF